MPTCQTCHQPITEDSCCYAAPRTDLEPLEREIDVTPTELDSSL